MCVCVCRCRRVSMHVSTSNLYASHYILHSTLFLTAITYNPQGELPPELGRVAFSNERASRFIEACLQHRDKRPSATELLAEDFLKPNEVRILRLKPFDIAFILLSGLRICG